MAGSAGSGFVAAMVGDAGARFVGALVGAAVALIDGALGAAPPTTGVLGQPFGPDGLVEEGDPLGQPPLTVVDELDPDRAVGTTIFAPEALPLCGLGPVAGETPPPTVTTVGGAETDRTFGTVAVPPWMAVGSPAAVDVGAAAVLALVEPAIGAPGTDGAGATETDVEPATGPDADDSAVGADDAAASGGVCGACASRTSMAVAERMPGWLYGSAGADPEDGAYGSVGPVVEPDAAAEDDDAYGSLGVNAAPYGSAGPACEVAYGSAGPWAPARDAYGSAGPRAPDDEPIGALAYGSSGGAAGAGRGVSRIRWVGSAMRRPWTDRISWSRVTPSTR